MVFILEGKERRERGRNKERERERKRESISFGGQFGFMARRSRAKGWMRLVAIDMKRLGEGWEVTSNKIEEGLRDAVGVINQAPAQCYQGQCR